MIVLTNSFLRVTLSSLLLWNVVTGCTEGFDSETGREPEKGKEYGYISIAIQVEETSQTRGPEEETDEGEAFENRIETMQLTLYQANTGISVYSFEIDVTTESIMHIEEQIPVDNYYALVTANTPAFVKELLQPGNWKEQFDQYEFTYTIATNHTSFYHTLTGGTASYFSSQPQDYLFFMSNFKKDLFLEGSKHIYPNAGEAGDHPFLIQLDRAVAKVKVEVNMDEVEIPENYKVEFLGWGIDASNRKTYLVRHPALKLDGTQEHQTDTDRSVLYAGDPNFDGVSRIRNPNSVVNPAWEFYDSGYELTNNTKPSWIYVAENTMAAEEQYPDVMTRVAFKFQVTPEGFEPGEGYYKWRGYLFSVNEMKGYTDDYTTIPIEYDGLAEALEQLKKSPTWNAGNPTGYIELPLISFYYKGENYYAVPIRHFSDEQLGSPQTWESEEAPAYGSYGVVRNNIYSVRIKSISDIGNPSIPKPGKEEGYVKFEIEVQNWLTRKIQKIEI